MIYSSYQLLFIIYKLIKGDENNDNFKKIECFSDFVNNKFITLPDGAMLLKRIIEEYKLKFSVTFDETPFFDKKYTDYSHLDDYIENTINEAFDSEQELYDEEKDDVLNAREYYTKYLNDASNKAKTGITNKWFLDFIEDTYKKRKSPIGDAFVAILSCVKFKLYRKDNIDEIKRRLNSYLVSFVNDNLDLKGENNYCNYQNNETELLKILKTNNDRYGKNFIIKLDIFFDTSLKDFRYLDTLIAFELIKDYILIDNLYFKGTELYCVIKLKSKLINKIEIKNSGRSLNNKAIFKNQVLIINNKTIDFKRKQNQSHLLASLFKNPKTSYFYLDIMDDWGEEFEKGKSWRKIYTAGDGINKLVAMETGIKDFIIKDTKQIQINPKYI